MKILLTGANGQLGRSFLEASKRFSNLHISAYSKTQLDICQLDDISTLPDLDSYDICINCAAYTYVENAENEEKRAFLINKDGVKNLAEVCSDHEIFLIHFSTDYVYHNGHERPLRENDLLNPQSVYAKSKLAGEVMVSKYTNRFIIFRTSWVYSAFGHNFLKTMLKLADTRNELNVVDDQIGTPTSAHSISKAILELLDRTEINHLNEKYGVYNLSNGGQTSWYGFAKKIFELSKKKMTINPISTSNYPSRVRRPNFSVLNNIKSQSQLSIIMPPWEESLENCIKDHLS